MGSGGTIYFVQGVEGGPIKIGYTADMARRLTGLHTGSPVPLTVLATCPGDPTDEQRLHDRFAAHRIRGEWFSPVAELLNAILSGAPLSFCEPLQEPLGIASDDGEPKKFEISLPLRMWEHAREKSAAEGLALVPWIRRLVALELAKTPREK